MENVLAMAIAIKKPCGPFRAAGQNWLRGAEMLA
jgi:hypothetical protein